MSDPQIFIFDINFLFYEIIKFSFYNLYNCLPRNPNIKNIKIEKLR